MAILVVESHARGYKISRFLPKSKQIQLKILYFLKSNNDEPTKIVSKCFYASKIVESANFIIFQVLPILISDVFQLGSNLQKEVPNQYPEHLLIGRY